MKQMIAKPLALKILFFFSSFFVFIAAFVLFCSFGTARFGDEFLKQLGITKTGADEKIVNGLLGGGVDLYGVKNAKNIALGNRKAVVLDLVAYAKKQSGSAAFVKQYNEMRERFRPKDYVPQTPEEMKAENIKRAKESVTQMEEYHRKADPQFKAMYQKSVDDARKYLKEAEDPANRQYVRYAQNYERSVREAKESNAANSAAFLRKYPDNHMLYVKEQLQRFMKETADVDFAAELVSKNGKKYFVNRAYESKGSYWKMAFRAGKEVVEPAREAVQQWINEIK